MNNKVWVQVYGCNKAQYLEWTKTALNSLFDREFSDAEVNSFVDKQLQTEAVVGPGKSEMFEYDFPSDKQFLPLEFDGISAIGFHNETLKALRSFGFSYDASLNDNPVHRFMEMQLQTKPGTAREAKFFLDRGLDADEELLYRTIDAIGHYDNWNRVSGQWIDFVFNADLNDEKKGSGKQKFVIFFLMQDSTSACITFSALDDNPMSNKALNIDFSDIPNLESMKLDMPTGLSKKDLMKGHAELMKFYNAIMVEPELAKHFIRSKP